MTYLTAEDILVLHARIVDATGGSHGVRDVGLLQSLVERPKTQLGGKDAYTTVFEKAATYLESLARYHVFTDGNKRTALAAAARFLFLNRYELRASNAIVERFVLKSVVVDQCELREISRWLKRYSKKE